jgi:hypothetical protein
MQVLRACALVGIFPLLASAHMQMHDPFPINSQEDPAVPDNLKEYTYTSPLLADGSDFPCKGFHKQATSHVSKAIYKAGETAGMTLNAPGAAHGGGSCQISLSYDNGDTWKVIKSIEGGCPITLTYDFTIPTDAPSSDDVLLGWTWFNLVGNREMYMNCARITVEGSTPGRHRRAQLAGRETALATLPDMFACNIGNGCTTKENQNVVFPEPGSNLVKGDNTMMTTEGNGFSGGPGGDGAASSDSSDSSGSPSSSTAPTSDVPAAASGSAPTSSPLFPNATLGASSSSQAAPPLGSNVVIPIESSTVTKPAASSTATSAAMEASTTAASDTAEITVSPLPKPSTSSSVISKPVTSSSTPSQPSTSASSTSCTPGAITCTSTTTWSMCVPGTGGRTSLTAMGSVALGTTCVDGKML